MEGGTLRVPNRRSPRGLQPCWQRHSLCIKRSAALPRVLSGCSLSAAQFRATSVSNNQHCACGNEPKGLGEKRGGEGRRVPARRGRASISSKRLGQIWPWTRFQRVGVRTRPANDAAFLAPPIVLLPPLMKARAQLSRRTASGPLDQRITTLHCERHAPCGAQGRPDDAFRAKP